MLLIRYNTQFITLFTGVETPCYKFINGFCQGGGKSQSKIAFITFITNNISSYILRYKSTFITFYNFISKRYKLQEGVCNP